MIFCLPCSYSAMLLHHRVGLAVKKKTKSSISIQNPADGNEWPPRALPEGVDKCVFNPSHIWLHPSIVLAVRDLRILCNRHCCIRLTGFIRELQTSVKYFHVTSTLTAGCEVRQIGWGKSGCPLLSNIICRCAVTFAWFKLFLLISTIKAYEVITHYVTTFKP